MHQVQKLLALSTIPSTDLEGSSEELNDKFRESRYKVQRKLVQSSEKAEPKFRRRLCPQRYSLRLYSCKLRLCGRSLRLKNTVY